MAEPISQLGRSEEVSEPRAGGPQPQDVLDAAEEVEGAAADEDIREGVLLLLLLWWLHLGSYDVLDDSLHRATEPTEDRVHQACCSLICVRLTSFDDQTGRSPPPPAAADEEAAITPHRHACSDGPTDTGPIAQGRHREREMPTEKDGERIEANGSVSASVSPSVSGRPPSPLFGCQLSGPPSHRSSREDV